MPKSLAEGEYVVSPYAPDYKVAPLVMDVLPEAELDRLAAHPLFAATARQMLRAMKPPSGDLKAMGRLLRDIGTFMAAVWALQLDVEPGGLTRASLSATMADWGAAGPGRVGALLVYLQVVKLIEAAPAPDGRAKRYRPTPRLRKLFHERFHREMTNSLPVMPQLAKVLARWDEPAVFDGFMVAHGRLSLAMQQSMVTSPTNMNPISHRKSGITILCQLLTSDETDARFPPVGPVVPNISELARVSGASRQQVLGIIKIGKSLDFIREDAEGRLHFTEEMGRNISAFVRIYWIHIAWSGEQALKWADGQAVRAA